MLHVLRAWFSTILSDLAFMLLKAQKVEKQAWQRVSSCQLIVLMLACSLREEQTQYLFAGSCSVLKVPSEVDWAASK